MSGIAVAGKTNWLPGGSNSIAAELLAGHLGLTCNQGKGLYNYEGASKDSHVRLEWNISKKESKPLMDGSCDPVIFRQIEAYVQAVFVAQKTSSPNVTLII